MRLQNIAAKRAAKHFSYQCNILDCCRPATEISQNIATRNATQLQLDLRNALRNGGYKAFKNALDDGADPNGTDRWLAARRRWIGGFAGSVAGLPSLDHYHPAIYATCQSSMPAVRGAAAWVITGGNWQVW